MILNAQKQSEEGPIGSSDKKLVSLPAVQTSRQMNLKGVFLHLLADALGSVIVIISALIIWLTDWEYKVYVDPTLSMILVVLILNSVWSLLKESALILLQTVPTHIQVDELERRLLAQVEGVVSVHEFHVWQLAGEKIIATAHLHCSSIKDYSIIAGQVKEFFHNEGIHSTTIQPEFPEDFNINSPANGHTDCLIQCPSKSPVDVECSAQTCCGTPQRLETVNVVAGTSSTGSVRDSSRSNK